MKTQPTYLRKAMTTLWMVRKIKTSPTLRNTRSHTAANQFEQIVHTLRYYHYQYSTP